MQSARVAGTAGVALRIDGVFLSRAAHSSKLRGDLEIMTVLKSLAVGLSSTAYRLGLGCLTIYRKVSRTERPNSV